MGLGFHSYTKAGIIPQIVPEREPPMPSENVELRRAGLKVTLPRIKILQILESTAASAEHLSAEDVYQRLRDMGEDVGLATVYRVLTQFETAELVTRHNFEGGHSVFELASDDHHDHMVDVDTNDVIEFYDEVIEKRQHEIAEEQGFEIIDHSLVLYVRKKN
jgi:Fur family ferric uptake transcriptional regulator